MIKIALDVSPVLDVLEDFDALGDAHAQSIVTKTIFRFSEPYTPKQTGIMVNSASVGRSTIEYNTPYASFVWLGKLMLGEETHSPFAKKYEKKYVTNTDLSYHGEPKRGAFWIDRMWAEQQDNILDDVAQQLFKEGY